MGLRSFYQITDTAFSEFVYYKMINCPPEVRGRLNPMELRYFRTKKAMRAFADDETLERRMVMLTRMGIRFTMTLYTDQADLDLAFKESDTSYHFAKKNVDLLNLMRKGDLFVFGSKTLSMMSLLAEHGCHSQGYVLDYQYLRTAKLLNGQDVMRRSAKIKEAEQMYADLAQVVFQGIACFNELVAEGGVTALNMRILLILVAHRNSFVTASTIKNTLAVAQTNRGTAMSLTAMVKNGLAYETKVPELEWEKKAYTISEKGLDKVMSFLKYVQQQIHDMS